MVKRYLKKIKQWLKKVCRMLILQCKNIDVHAIIKSLELYNYVLLKSEVPYMPNDFPKHYAVGKDIDIVCAFEDFTPICDIIRIHLQNMRFPYKVKEVDKSDKNKLYRVELYNEPICQFDISSGIAGVDDAFVEEMLSRREKVGEYYVPCIEDELIVRMYEIRYHRSKQYHIDYVIQHIVALPRQRCSQILGDDIESILDLMERSTGKY